MTVSASGRSKTYAIAAGVTGYPVPFPVIAASDLFVYVHDGIAFDSDAPGAQLTEGVHYTISGAANTGTASIVPTPVFPTTGYVTLYRVTSMAQSAAYTPNDGFPAATHEAQLDRLSLVDQEQQAQADELSARVVKVPPGETGALIDPLATRQSRLPLWSQSGDLSSLSPGTAGGGVVTVTPTGIPVVISQAAIAGRGDGQDYRGGIAEKTGDTFYGGLAA